LAKFGFGKNLSLHRKQSAKLSCVNELILSKFEACLLGSLIGDCIGKKFEGIWGPNLGEMLDDYRLLKEKLEHLDQTQDSDTYNTSFESYLNENKRPYTDDTALTRALCESFINFGDFDLEHQASVFELAYSSDPNRGYSSGSIVMFKKLNKLKQANELEKKCLVPAMELFNGEGSYGNGGGAYKYLFFALTL
jgi:poly(ADP-ribose) glycohydrolase ARH3